MSEGPGRDLLERAVLPVFIPVAAIVVTEILVFSLSRVLLTAGEKPAVVVALGVALGILVGSAAIAARPRLRTATIVGLLVVLGLGLAGAGIVAAQKGPTYKKESSHGESAAAQVSATDLAFDTKTIKLPAGNSTIEFHNMDSVTHNIAIFADEKSLQTALFRGDVVASGAKKTYEVKGLEAGSYFFHCDVHPTMTGSVVVT